MNSPKELALNVARSIRGYVARTMAGFDARLKAVEDNPQVMRELTADERKSLAESLLPHMEAAHSRWAIEFERSATDLMLKTIANIPEPRDGQDGIGWDDMRVEHDGKRMVSFIFKKGEHEHTAEIKIPCVIDAGFWKDGMKCEEGDGVTFGGSYWIAQKKTESKPDIGNPDFRLAVKKGRDGKDADRVPTRPVLQVP